MQAAEIADRESKTQDPISDDEMAAALELNLRIAKWLRSQSYAVQLLGEVDEVAQIGAIGVAKAAQAFDRSRGVKFATFAGARSRGEILDAARNVSFIRVPRSAIAKGAKVATVDSLQRIRAFHQNESGNDSGWEPSTEPRREGEADYLVERFLQSLSRKERSIVRLYFGFGSGLPLSMKEIGQLHKLSESRVSQLMSQIFLRAGESHFFAELN